jgi:putative two-component system response regulator
MLEGRKKVILVDDNPINLKLARNTLMSKYDVFTVPSAEKLFQLLEKTVPDIILLDVLMPEMSGYEAIKILKQDDKTADIPVIFLTSKSDTGSELEGFVLGAVDYISKPFSPQILLKRVETQVLLEEQKRELRILNEDLQEQVKERTADIRELQSAVIKTLSSFVECRDVVTGDHLEQTERFLRPLVDELRKQKVYAEEMDRWDLDVFLQSAQLHDVGKIVIRDEILLKEGRLTDDEYEQMKMHAHFGEEVIERIQQNARESSFLEYAKTMARTHHERWDGKGYPDGLKGLNIPLQGRLMAIVDVYHALISKRPYKEAFTPDEALKIIEEGKGTHFDPILVDVFTAVAKQFTEEM